MRANRKKGFSLAEILITLAVIGVVAAMGIPALFNNTKNQENVVALKKYAGTLESSLRLYMANNGCSGDLSVCTSSFSTVDELYNIFKPSLSVAKDCGTASGLGCFSSGVNYKKLNSSIIPSLGIFDGLGYYTVRLVDGAALYIDILDSSCSQDRSRSNNGPLFHVCGTAVIDVNGVKSPNQAGRDTFIFFITRSGVIPIGTYDDVDYSNPAGIAQCDPSSVSFPAGLGWGCTAKVLQEGAMNY